MALQLNNIYDTPPFVIENKILKGRKISLPDDGKSLGEILLDNFKKDPDFVGQIDAETGETCTYGKLANDSIRCAIWLKKQGIGSGDIVTICSHNNLASWAPFCAVFYIGANLNTWYHNWSPESAKHSFNEIKPKIIFANEKAGNMLKKLVKEENFDTKIVVFGKVSGLESFNDIIQQQSSEEVKQFQCRKVDPTDDCLVLFSSGSTGLPKGVQHSFKGVYYNIYKWNVMLKEIEGVPLTYTSSMNWITACLTMLQSLLSKSPAVIISNPSPKELCKTIEKYQVQYALSGTGIINELSISEVLSQYNLSSLKILTVGGAKMRPEAIKRVNKMLKNGQIILMYGSTEIFMGICQLNKKKQNYESCGVVYLDTEIKVVDTQTGDILGPNQKGELNFKHKYLMKSYRNRPTETAEALDSDGWFHSGDLGYYDEEGNVFIIERLKDVIKYRGHQISPAEIESILLKHPKVLDVVVVPVPHLIDDEHPIAFVKVEKDSKVSKEELLELTSELDDTKKLRGGIVFLEEFPLLPTMKIDKNKLKEMAKVYGC